jgi:enoyl-CoA hydratase
MSSPGISVERRERVAIVTIQNEKCRDALARQGLDQISAVFLELSREKELRAIILSGVGMTDFSPGTDSSDLASLDQESVLASGRRSQQACDAVARCEIPVIAAINGTAAGLGLELAMAAHIRIAASNANFAFEEAGLDTLHETAAAQRLRQILGAAHSDAGSIVGTVDAAEAFSLGLVNRIVEPSAVLEESLAFAAEVAELAPLAIRACLQAVTRGIEMSVEDGLELEARLFSELFATEDVREGTRAFLEKRKPVFRGR